MDINKQGEVNTSLLITELLYLTEAYKDFLSSSELVSRTTKPKVRAATVEFLHTMEAAHYTTVSTGCATLKTEKITETIVFNTIASMQKEALEVFAIHCDVVLKEYTGDRVTVTYYISKVEEAVAKQAHSLMSAFTANRLKALKEGITGEEES